MEGRILTVFDTAWELVKMPVHLEHDNEYHGEGDTLSVYGPLWQGRRAGMKDTGYWTPHKDKALAYALFGTRYDWAGDNKIDARESIPELYRYDPGENDIYMLPDTDYMPYDLINRALALRRVAFKDEYGEIEEGLIGADLDNEGIYPEKISDNELADMIQRLRESEYFDEGEPYENHHGLTNYENLMNLENLNPDFDEDEWERIFQTRPSQDWDNIQRLQEYGNADDYFDMGFSEPTWDLSVVSGLKGGNLMNLINNLRERGQ